MAARAAGSPIPIPQPNAILSLSLYFPPLSALFPLEELELEDDRAADVMCPLSVDNV